MFEHLTCLGLNRWKARIAAAAVIGILLISGPAVRAQALQEQRAFYIFFKVPGSTSTAPLSINTFFTVTGNYIDAKGTHGFLRDVFGKITVFDVPGSVSTNPVAINDQGAVTGTFQDTNGVTHGFVREPWGRINCFDPSGSTNTNPASINAFGAIAGVFFNSNGPEAFVRSPSGDITSFEPGGRATGINLFGTITGSTNPPSNPGGPPPPILVLGFVRTHDGTITTFVDPMSGSSGTFPTAIDSFGDIAGFYFNYQDYQFVFFRSASGGYTTVSPPNSFQTSITGLSELGDMVGYYNNLPNGVGPDHSFVRDRPGNITTFDVPGGGTPASINNFGVIVGAGPNGGFLRVPF